MKLSVEEASQVIDHDHEDWERASGLAIEDHSRWAVHQSQIFKHIPSGKYYEFYWSVGATESQDMDLDSMFGCYGEQQYEPTEVIEVISMVKKWVSPSQKLHNLDDLVSLLTDPENQPHQYVGKEEDLHKQLRLISD